MLATGNANVDWIVPIPISPMGHRNCRLISSKWHLILANSFSSVHFLDQSLLLNSPMQPVLGEDLPKLLTGNELMLSFGGLNDADTIRSASARV